MALSSFIRISVIRVASLFFKSKKSKVLFYHDIHAGKKYTAMSTSIELFRKHIQIIRENGYEIVSKITKPNNQIEISFDDGFMGVYDNIDVIIELDISIQLFVVTSYLDTENYLNRSQLLELDTLSQIIVSSHTHTHSILNRVSEKEVVIELETSKKLLENILGKQVNSLCFPEGKFSNKVIKIAQKYGYNSIYSSLPGFYFNDFLPNVKRRSLVQFSRKKEFKAILKGGDHILAFWYIFKHYKK